MKKIALFAAVLALAATPALALTPDSSKAANGAVLDASGAASVTSFMRFSKGVYAGAVTNSTGYALTTAHTSGTKYYGTGYDSTAIYVKDAAGVVGTTLAAPSSSVTSEAFTTGWSKL
jgi:Zn-dependent M28 family amino/carboxypeptidase